MTEPSIYAKAIDVIHDRGHHKGQYEGWPAGHGPVCADGAIRVACHGTPHSSVHSGCSGACIRSSVRLDHSVGTAIMCWNDAPERTKEDVILLLKYADAGELPTWKALYGPGAEADEA